MAYKYFVKTFTLRNGKRKYIRGKTKKELDEKVARFQRELGLGIRVDEETTVEEYAEHWFKTTRSVGVSEHTALDIHSTLARRIYPFIGKMRVRDVRASHIREIMYNVSSLGHRSQANVLRLLRGIFDAALDDDLILKSPVPVTLKPGGATEGEAEWLTPEQEVALLEAAKETNMYGLVYTMLNTGLRRGEAMALMWSDIDYEAGLLWVRRHSTPDRAGRPVILPGAKTKAGERYVPLPDALAAYLRAEQSKAKSVYVFPNTLGRPISSTSLTQMWKTLNRHAGFETHPHMLRHTYVTKLFEAGLDVKQIQHIVGHSSPGITLKVYTHYRASLRDQSTIEQVKAALAE